MSRVAKQPVTVPKGVDVTIDGASVSAKGPKGTETMTLHESVEAKLEDGVLGVSALNRPANGATDESSDQRHDEVDLA